MTRYNYKFKISKDNMEKVNIKNIKKLNKDDSLLLNKENNILLYSSNENYVDTKKRGFKDIDNLHSHINEQLGFSTTYSGFNNNENIKNIKQEYQTPNLF